VNDQAQAVLQLARVHGRDAQGASGASLGRLHGVTLLLYPGVHAVLGRPADGTAALAELCAGRTRPRNGAVLVAGHEPHRSPRRRRRIGAVLAHPELPETHVDVKGTLQLIGELRGVDLVAELSALGAGVLAERELPSLSRAEARAVELVIALGTAAPLVVVLYEPFADIGPIDRVAVRQRVTALGAAGACVVLVTATPSDVEGLADQVHLLARGRLVGTGEHVGWPDVTGGQITLWLEGRDGDNARALAAALGERGAPTFGGVAWEQLTPEAPPLVVARVDDVAAGAIAIAETVTELGIRIAALHSEPLSLKGLAAAVQAREAALRAGVHGPAGAGPAGTGSAGSGPAGSGPVAPAPPAGSDRVPPGPLPFGEGS